MNLEHVAINVPDVQAQVQWWKEHLGMRIVAAGDTAPYMNFIADEKGSMLELYSRTDVAPPDYAEINSFNLHFAFSVEDMEGERARLIEAGATPVDEITTTPSGDRLCFLHDPWKVTVQLVERKTPML